MHLGHQIGHLTCIVVSLQKYANSLVTFLQKSKLPVRWERDMIFLGLKLMKKFGLHITCYVLCQAKCEVAVYHPQCWLVKWVEQKFSTQIDRSCDGKFN